MREKGRAVARIPVVSAQKPQILAIIGQGYVGLPLAMAAVDAGWSVIGVDNFAAKVAQINSGSSPVEDISDAQLKAALSSGAYRATTEFSDVANASVITICVPTPLDEKREPDLTLLRSAAMGIAPFVTNETLVVSESTSYPGTLRDVIIPIINSSSVESITHSTSEPKLARRARRTSDIPFSLLKFFLGNPLLPPRAGIITTLMCVIVSQKSSLQLVLSFRFNLVSHYLCALHPRLINNEVRYCCANTSDWWSWIYWLAPE